MKQRVDVAGIHCILSCEKNHVKCGDITRSWKVRGYMSPAPLEKSVGNLDGLSRKTDMRRESAKHSIMLLMLSHVASQVPGHVTHKMSGSEEKENFYKSRLFGL